MVRQEGEKLDSLQYHPISTLTGNIQKDDMCDDGHGLIYLDNRLKNRKTFVEWDKILMGPIHDLLGVE